MKVGLENVHTASALRDWVNGHAAIDNGVRHRMSSQIMIHLLDDVDSIYKTFEAMDDGVSAYRTFTFRFIAELAKVSLPVFRDHIYDSMTR